MNSRESGRGIGFGCGSRRIAFAAAGIFLCAVAAAQQPGNSVAPTQSVIAAGTESAPATPVSIPSYPNNAQGLENLVKDMLKLQKDGNQQQLAAYEKSLALPDPEAWFKAVFGEKLGSQMVVISAPMRLDALVHTGDMLAAQIKEQRTEIRVVRFDDSCNPDATPTEYPFLLLRKTPERLYDVRFIGSKSAALWAYFAYVDGGFRLIGNMKKKELGIGEIHPPVPPDRRVPIVGTVQAAKLVHQVQPVYPQAAKELGLQGKVVLHAVIAKDGSIRDLYLNEGQCMLAESAMDAVKNWRYSPTTLFGEPVEVDTTIQVIFTLGR